MSIERFCNECKLKRASNTHIGPKLENIYAQQFFKSLEKNTDLVFNLVYRTIKQMYQICENFHFLITLLPIFFLDSNGHYEERGANLEAEHKFLLYRKYNRIFDRENSM